MALASITRMDWKVQLNGGAFGVGTACKARLHGCVSEVPTAGCLGHSTRQALLSILLSCASPPFSRETPRRWPSLSLLHVSGGSSKVGLVCLAYKFYLKTQIVSK